MDMPFDSGWKDILAEHIRTSVERSGNNGVVLGLSGGLDSAVVLALAVKALGPENVHAVLMPYDDSPSEDMSHARDYARHTGVKMEEVVIGDIVDAVTQNSIGGGGMAEANVHARIRMVLLYYMANSHSLLVMGTSNKTELMIGYFTKYGDGGADLCPIGDLYKTQVRKMAVELGVPEAIINKKPSAGLPGVAGDEEEIGYMYPDIDKMLYGMELGWDDERIAESTNMSIDAVKDLRNMVCRSRHKRGLGMVPKIGIKTVGLDLREDRSC